MQPFDKAALFHAVESLGAFALAAFLCWLFKDTLVRLIELVFNDPTVASAIVGGVALLLGAVFSGVAKRLRVDPKTSVPDYVKNAENGV